MSKIANIIGVKEASGDLEQVSRIIKGAGDEFLIYSGDDFLTLPILALGGHGVISVASHLAGNQIKEMIEAYDSGDAKRAAALHYRLMDLFKILFITANPVPVKAALALTGTDVGGVRLPLVEATTAEKERITAVLKDMEL